MSMTEIKRDIAGIAGSHRCNPSQGIRQSGPDGVAGGSPHMHFACSEAYLVIKGRGSVQTLSSAGFREIPLRAGSLVWFTPGLIHRLINEDACLEIFAVMENAGLPEHGDSVFTFPSKHLRDEDSYLQVASLESGAIALCQSARSSSKAPGPGRGRFSHPPRRTGKRRISPSFLPPGGTFNPVQRTCLARDLGIGNGENDSTHQNLSGPVESRDE